MIKTRKVRIQVVLGPVMALAIAGAAQAATIAPAADPHTGSVLPAVTTAPGAERALGASTVDPRPPAYNIPADPVRAHPEASPQQLEQAAANARARARAAEGEAVPLHTALIGTQRDPPAPRPKAAATEPPKKPVAAVPLPGASWLFGSALLAFLGIAARRKL